MYTEYVDYMKTSMIICIGLQNIFSSRTTGEEYCLLSLKVYASIQTGFWTFRCSNEAEGGQGSLEMLVNETQIGMYQAHINGLKGVGH